MRYSRLLLSSSLRPEYCRGGRIEGGEGAELMIGQGESASGRYPDNLDQVRVHLDEVHLGLALPDQLTNSSWLLMWSRAAHDALTAELELGPHELYPFLLINHKRRVHSRDYVFVNPLGGRDIAHADARFERFESTGYVFDCEHWVLDSAKLDGAPDLVRCTELPIEYFVSERFVDAVARLGLSNFVFAEVEQQ